MCTLLLVSTVMWLELGVYADGRSYIVVYAGSVHSCWGVKNVLGE